MAQSIMQKLVEHGKTKEVEENNQAKVENHPKNGP